MYTAEEVRAAFIRSGQECGLSDDEVIEAACTLNRALSERTLSPHAINAAQNLMVVMDIARLES